MKKDDYINLANELEVEVVSSKEGQDPTIADYKEQMCDALIAERGEHAEEVAGLNAELSVASKSIEAKAPVIQVNDVDYKFIGKKHMYKLETITAEILKANSELAEACVDAGVGFLVEL